jgi:hypothetical protein
MVDKRTHQQTVAEMGLDTFASKVSATLVTRGFANRVFPQPVNHYHPQERPLVVTDGGEEYRFCISFSKGSMPLVYFRFKEIGSRRKVASLAIDEIVDAIVGNIDFQRERAKAAERDDEARPLLERISKKVFAETGAYTSVSLGYGIPLLKYGGGHPVNFSNVTLPSDDADRAVEAVKMIKEAEERISAIHKEVLAKVYEMTVENDS